MAEDTNQVVFTLEEAADYLKIPVGTMKKVKTWQAWGGVKRNGKIRFFKDRIVAILKGEEEYQAVH